MSKHLFVLVKLSKKIPDVQLSAVGSYEEDPIYYLECIELANNIGLGDDLKFLGHVNFKEFLNEMDLLVLTSISEAQPLVILEAGAAGIPTVATHVGGCSQLYMGMNPKIHRLEKEDSSLP